MVKVLFWNKEKSNLDEIRRLQNEGYVIIADPQHNSSYRTGKVCVLLDPGRNPKRVNELCKMLSYEAVIYVLMEKGNFLSSFPYQKMKLQIEDDSNG